MEGGEGTYKEASGCRPLGGDTARLAQKLAYYYIETEHVHVSNWTVKIHNYSAQ